MYHHYYFPHLPGPYCLAIILFCTVVLLVSHLRWPATYPKRQYTLGGLVGLVVGVELAALKWLIEPSN